MCGLRAGLTSNPGRAEPVINIGLSREARFHVSCAGRDQADEAGSGDPGRFPQIDACGKSSAPKCAALFGWECALASMHRRIHLFPCLFAIKILYSHAADGYAPLAQECTTVRRMLCSLIAHTLCAIALVLLVIANWIEIELRSASRVWSANRFTRGCFVLARCRAHHHPWPCSAILTYSQ